MNSTTKIFAHTMPPPEGYSFLAGAFACLFFAGVCFFVSFESGKNAPKRDSGVDGPSDIPRQTLIVVAWILCAGAVVLTITGILKILST